MMNLFQLVKTLFHLQPVKIEKLKGDGSNRKFFRIFFNNSSLILILPQEGEYGLKEAYSYYELGNFFYKNHIPVPKIEFWSPETGILIVEDLGNTRLFDIKNFSEKYYFKAIQILAKFQKLVSSFPVDKTVDTPVYSFDFLWEKEIKYFFEWYIRRYKKIKIPESFIEEIFFWAKEEANFVDQIVMHRDFQSKNLMIKNDNIFIVDFQGARLGPPAYDLASLLFDPYINYFNQFSEISYFIEYYLKLTKYPHKTFLKEFKFLSIVRLKQALAAYCKLSSLGKNWFLEYIPRAENRLFSLLQSFYPDIYKNYKTLLNL